MRTLKFLAPLMTLMLILAACGNGDGGDGGNGGNGGDGGEGSPDVECPETSSEASENEIIVTSLWGGAEEEAFQAVLDAFEEESGITATYEPNRTDYATVLRTRIQGGNPPDVAIIPGIGFLRSFARDGSIVPLECYDINAGDVEGEYVSGMMDAGNVDGTQYGLMAKVNSKATIWYDPQRFSEYGVEPVETWENLVGISEEIAAQDGSPWSLAAADGWTLTDWFEATYLKMHGADAYRTLFSADGDWTDGTAQAAIEKMYGELLTADHVDGGIDGALATAFVDGIAKVFSTNPTAEMYCCGAFVGGIAASGDVNPDLEYGTDIDWFPFPTIEDGAGELTDISYGGDVIAGLTNRPEVGEFLRFMTTVEAGTAWAEGGTIISPLSGVETSVYPESVQKEAEQIANATTAVFDGSDLLPAGPDLGALLQSAFRGDDPAALLEDFQAQIEPAWESE